MSAVGKEKTSPPSHFTSLGIQIFTRHAVTDYMSEEGTTSQAQTKPRLTMATILTVGVGVAAAAFLVRFSSRILFI